MDRVFIANFGRGNYAWERCRKNPSVATMNNEDTHQFWIDGDRDGYYNFTIEKQKAAGERPSPKNTISRWYNLMTIIVESSGDFWVHRDGEEIWWTRTLDSAPVFDKLPQSVPYQELKVFECHKPCQPWSDKDSNGKQLRWSRVSEEMQNLLNVQGTLQEKTAAKRDAVLALINGGSVGKKSETQNKDGSLKESKKTGSWDESAKEMMKRARKTTEASNGQKIERILKDKNFGFDSDEDCERYLRDLLRQQGNQCALTGLPLQPFGFAADEWMTCSLDRIDSNGHYESGNLQIVCRFINRWKSDMDDSEFLRLVRIVQETKRLD